MDREAVTRWEFASSVGKTEDPLARVGAHRTNSGVLGSIFRTDGCGNFCWRPSVAPPNPLDPAIAVDQRSRQSM